MNVAIAGFAVGGAAPEDFLGGPDIADIVIWARVSR